MSVTSMPSVRDVSNERSPLHTVPRHSTLNVQASNEMFPQEDPSPRPSKRRRQAIVLDYVLVPTSGSLGYPRFELSDDEVSFFPHYMKTRKV
jgi:hypothetical protein